MAFKIADAFVEIHADSTGLRGEVDRATKEAGAGQDIKVGLQLREGSVGGLIANLAPLIIPATAAVAELTGALGLVPAALSAVGLAVGTVAVGLQGFKEAVKSGGDALNALSPSAREAAVAIRDLRPAWDNLRLDVQQRLFEGVAKDIQRLAIVDLPVLRRGMDEMATALNQGVHYLTVWATASKTVADFRTIMTNSSVATQNFMRALQPILGIFRDLSVVGSQFLPQLALHFAQAAQRVADFVSHARETGQLASWMQQGITATGQLWQAIKNLVAIIMQFAQAGVSLLPVLVQVTGFIRQLLHDFPELIPIITGLIAAWRAYVLVQAAVNAVMLANPIGLLIAGIALLITAVVLLVTHWQQFKDNLIAVWNAIQAAAGAVWNAIATVIQTAVTIAINYVTNAWNQIRSTTQAIWDGIRSTISAAWQAIQSAVSSAANAVMSTLTSAWNSVRSTAQSAWNSINSTISSVWNTIRSTISSAANAVMSTLTSAWNSVRSTAVSAWNGIVSAVRSSVDSMLGVVRSIPGAITSALGNLGSLLYNAGRSVIQGLINGIQSMIGAVQSAISSVASAVRGALPFSPAEYGPLRDYPPEEAGATISELIAEGMSGNVGTVVNAAQLVAGSALSGLPDVVKYGTVSESVWNSLLAAGWTGRAGDNMEALYRPAASGTGSLPDVVKYGSVSDALWNSLLAQGWKGRAGDNMEALYRPGPSQVTVNVTQTSGSPAETGRFVALALRTVA